MVVDWDDLFGNILGAHVVEVVVQFRLVAWRRLGGRIAVSVDLCCPLWNLTVGQARVAFGRL